MCTPPERSQAGRSQAGLTLVELVISIAILSIAVAGTLKLVQITTRGSADPMLAQQASFVAEAYLSEILTKQFPAAAPCSATPPAVPRASYSSICDYESIAGEDPTDQTGTAIPGLGRLDVFVDIDTNAHLGSLTGWAGGVVRVDVRVQYPGGNVWLSGYRTNLS